MYTRGYAIDSALHGQVDVGDPKTYRSVKLSGQLVEGLSFGNLTVLWVYRFIKGSGETR